MEKLELLCIMEKLNSCALLVGILKEASSMENSVVALQKSKRRMTM